MSVDDHDSDDGVDTSELQVTGLTPHGEHEAGAYGAHPASRRGARFWRWAPLAVSLIALAALIVSALPATRSLFGALALVFQPSVAATPETIVRSSINVQFDLTPTANLSAQRAPALAEAPATCLGGPPTLSHVGPPRWGAAIGYAPVWLAGMSGAYPTLRLGPQASANAYDWDAPYTQFGWPAPIGVMLKNGFNGPVRLTGWNISTGEVVSFGFVQAGAWGAPLYVSPDYTLDLAKGMIPAGGSDSTGVFWYGYAFLPRAGCYAMTASWQGGSWKAVVSAGR